MRGFAFLALIAAACGDNDGVYIDVRIPAGMDAQFVDLFLGQRCDNIGSDDCNSLTPPRLDASTTRPEITGEVYFADDPEVFRSTVEDGVAHFYLQPAKGKIEAAIAVAHRGADELGVTDNTGVALLQLFRLDETQRLIVDLQPVAADHMLGQDLSLEIWSAPDFSYRCAGVDVGGRRVFVVPRDDADCDQVRGASTTEGECAPTSHLADEPPKDALVDQECALLEEDTSICVLGDRPCNEVAPTLGTGETCEQGSVTYCVPDAVCACETFDDACIQSLIENDPTSPPEPTRIECVIEYEDIPGGGGGTRSCEDKPLNEIPISGDPCGDPEIAMLDRSMLEGFAPTLTMTDPAGTVELVPIVVGTSCSVGLQTPNVTFPNGEPASDVHHEVLKLDVDLANPGTRFLLLPIDITFVRSPCIEGQLTKCVLHGLVNDRMFTCVR